MRALRLTIPSLVAVSGVLASGSASADCDPQSAAASAVISLADSIAAASAIATTHVAVHPKDVTPPPQPNIQVSIAYGPWSRSATTGPRRDPAYVEFSNIETGTRLFFVNRSRNPNAGDKEKQEYKITGANLLEGRAASAINAEEMTALGIRSGDVYTVWAVDPSNNRSQPTTHRFSPLRSNTTHAFLQANGSRVNTQTGPEPDVTAPVILEQCLRFETKDGKAQIVGDGAVEPFATVAIRNQRTGVTVNPSVGVDPATGKGLLRSVLPANTVEGDPLLISVTDVHGVRSEKVVGMVYSAHQPDAGQVGQTSQVAQAGQVAQGGPVSQP